MLSYSDLLSRDGEEKEEENQDFAQCDQEDLDGWDVCQDEIIIEDEKKEEIEVDGVIAGKYFIEIRTEYFIKYCRIPYLIIYSIPLRYTEKKSSPFHKQMKTFIVQSLNSTTNFFLSY